MTFGEALRATVALYGGVRAAARRVGVPRYTLQRWMRLASADTLQVGTLDRIHRAFPEIMLLTCKEEDCA